MKGRETLLHDLNKRREVLEKSAQKLHERIHGKKKTWDEHYQKAKMGREAWQKISLTNPDVRKAKVMLGLQQKGLVTPEQVQKAFRRQAKKHHPDAVANAAGRQRGPLESGPDFSSTVLPKAVNADKEAGGNKKIRELYWARDILQGKSSTQAAQA